MDGLLNDALTAAKKLLGYKLVLETSQGRLSGYIVETEAYHQEDQASHTFRGRTLRTEPMFGPAGNIYVYFTYGMHYCMNIVTGPEGRGEAVLIRAVEPVEGLEIMRLNRRTTSDFNLTNGPAKLCQALGVDKSLSGTNLTAGPFKLEKGIVVPGSEIVTSTRVGIREATEQPWRFYIRNNPYVSKL